MSGEMIDESVLSGLAGECASAGERAARDRRWAEAKQREAESAGELAAELAAVREWVTPRVGMTWADAIAEAEAELEKAEAAVAAAAAECERLREEARDLLGYQRVLERQIADGGGR